MKKLSPLSRLRDDRLRQRKAAQYTRYIVASTAEWRKLKKRSDS